MKEKTDLRVEKTYMFLHNAFTELLEEKRFEDFTVNELCERAMIRRTTFYKHFADKYEYFSFYIKEISSGFHDQLPPDIFVSDPETYLICMCRETLHFIEAHRRLVANVERSNMFPVLLNSLSEYMRGDMLQALKQIESTKNMSQHKLEGIAAFYSGGLLNALYLYIKSGKKLDEEELIDVVSSFSIRIS
ncbi:MAG: TetR/AcrR family transcriptional regulator [Oscillospiraceae bacterium]